MAPPTRVPSFWTWVPPPGEAECRDRQISENDPKKGISVPLLCYLRSAFPMLVQEERAGPCLVPSNRTLHYQNTGIVTDPFPLRYAADVSRPPNFEFGHHECVRVFITNVKGTFLGMSESEEASKRR